MTDRSALPTRFVPLHPMLQDIRGMCSDELPYPELDEAIAQAVDRTKDMEDEIKRLQQEVRDLHADAVREHVAEEYVKGLQEALRAILLHGTTTDPPHECWASHPGDCADRFREIARAALGGERS